MYDSMNDIEEISLLMGDIQEGKVSRNKNFYTLAKAKEYNRFKRAKLLLSLLEDLEQTDQIEGSRIKVEAQTQAQCMAISLYNPNLKYNRTVLVSKEELELLNSRTSINLSP